MDSSQQEGQDEGQVQDVKDQAREKAGEAAEQAKQTAQGYAEQAQDRIREQVDQRTTQAGERVGSTAQDIRSVGEALRDQGKEGPAKLADQAADRVEQAGGYLRDSDGDRILDDVENFGRRRPWAVLAGGVLAGIAAARFLKASSRERYSSRELRGTTSGNGSGRELAPGSATTESAEEAQLATPAGVR